MNIIVDSCFWIALYDERDNYHVWANDQWNILQGTHKFLVPYPTMYEFIKTRMMKRQENVLFFQELFSNRENIARISDEQYKDDALQATLQPSPRSISLVDMTIRLMLEDDSIKKHALLTLNVGDFEDVCRRKQIEIIDCCE